MADECDNGLGTQIEQLREECAKEGAWLQNRSHQIIEKFHRNKGAAESAAVSCCFNRHALALWQKLLVMAEWRCFAEALGGASGSLHETTLPADVKEYIGRVPPCTAENIS